MCLGRPLHKGVQRWQNHEGSLRPLGQRGGSQKGCISAERRDVENPNPHATQLQGGRGRADQGRNQYVMLESTDDRDVDLFAIQERMQHEYAARREYEEALTTRERDLAFTERGNAIAVRENALRRAQAEQPAADPSIDTVNKTD